MGVAAFLLAATAMGSGPIDPARLSADTRVMATDDFAGRAPGGPGEAKTVAFLVDRFKALGLQGGAPDGGWTQAVPLVRTRVGAGRVAATVGGVARPLVQGRDVYLGTVRAADRAVVDAPLVFVGHGVRAPERGWDDFKGADLRGKVLVFLVNDPDYAAAPGEPAAGRFGGKRMTYYGRWTYKYEEAARQGAAAALIIHDTGGAGYGWSTVVAPGGETFALRPAAGDPPRLPLQGWLSAEAAAALFARAGLDLDALRAAARRPDFRPVPLAATFAADLPVAHEAVESRNVLARLPGATRPGEAILFGAHWDAYGTGAPDTAGRTVRAGAADDAIGVAGVLELARAFRAAPPPGRTLLFAAWTGEERGLLGSAWYAAHPTVPLARTVADLTMDVLQTAGPARDVVLVGDGQSELDDLLADAARAQGRTVTPEALPERGLFYRADHFSAARLGVPALLLMGLGGGADLVAGGRAAGDQWLADYMKCYHQACDTWSAAWDLRGAAQDVDLFYRMGRRLADGRDWPDWRPGSEFKAIRAATAAERR